MSLARLHEFRNAVDCADLAQHVERRFVGAAMRGPPETSAAGGDAGERIGAGGAGEPHRRGRRVLLVVGVQDEDAVHRARQHRVRLELLGRHRVAHAQEVGGIVEIVLGINERLADRIFIRHGGERRHFRDHAQRRDHALHRIGDVGGVVIERRQRADRAGHDRHRMRVAAEALEEAAHLLMHHGVARDAIVEVGLLRRRRQFAVEQQVTGFEEVAVFGQLLDRVAAVEQDAFIAVDVGDLGLAACGRGEAGVVGEHPALAVELGDVHHVGADGALVDREVPILVTDGNRAGWFGGGPFWRPWSSPRIWQRAMR